MSNFARTAGLLLATLLLGCGGTTTYKANFSLTKGGVTTQYSFESEGLESDTTGANHTATFYGPTTSAKPKPDFITIGWGPMPYSSWPVRRLKNLVIGTELSETTASQPFEAVIEEVKYTGTANSPLVFKGTLRGTGLEHTLAGTFEIGTNCTDEFMGYYTVGMCGETVDPAAFKEVTPGPATASGVFVPACPDALFKRYFSTSGKSDGSSVQFGGPALKCTLHDRTKRGPGSASTLLFCGLQEKVEVDGCKYNVIATTAATPGHFFAVDAKVDGSCPAVPDGHCFSTATGVAK